MSNADCSIGRSKTRFGLAGSTASGYHPGHVLFPAQCDPVPPQPVRQRLSPRQEKPRDLLERLPQTIAGCQKGEIHDYGQPELGYSVSYKANGLTVTAYVYDLGRNTVTDGIADPAITQAFELAKTEIKVQETRGVYSGVRLLGEGSGSALWAKYELTSEIKGSTGIGMFSEIHVFGAWDHIVKLRISGLLADQETLAPIAAKFVPEFVKSVQFLPPGKK